MIIAEFKIQSIEELISTFLDKYKNSSYSALDIFLEIILDSIAERRSFDLEDSSWPIELVQLFAKTCIARQKRDMQGIIKNISKVGMDEENAEFIGIAKFSKIGAAKLIEELKHILKTDLNASLINTIDNLIKIGETVEAYDIKDAKFIDIDFPEDFERAKKLFT